MRDLEELTKIIVNFNDRTGDFYTEVELAEEILESAWFSGALGDAFEEGRLDV